MEIIRPISKSEGTSLFCTPPSSLIDGFSSLVGGIVRPSGLELGDTTYAEYFSSQLSKMIETSKSLEGFGTEPTSRFGLDDGLLEIQYRILERKTNLLEKLKQNMPALNSPAMGYQLYTILMDDVLEVSGCDRREFKRSHFLFVVILVNLILLLFFTDNAKSSDVYRGYVKRKSIGMGGAAAAAGAAADRKF